MPICATACGDVRVNPRATGPDDGSAGSAADHEILNAGLALAMDWGKDWLQPITARLRRAFPALTAAEAKRCNAVCKAAMERGIALVFELAAEHAGQVDQAEWRRRFAAQYPWAHAGNLGHLFSQGMYYAYKDGALAL
jgi:hypothetical protein